MKILSVALKNFKGFVDTGVVELGPRWTVVVGQNSVGKTAFLEGLGIRDFADKAHRSPRQPEGKLIDKRSYLQMRLSIGGAELEDTLLTLDNHEVWIPAPAGVGNEQEFCRALFDHSALTFELVRTGSGDWRTVAYPSHGLFKGESQRSLRVRHDANELSWRILDVAGGQSDTLAYIVSMVLNRSCFAFKAERRVVGNSTIQQSMNLSPNAANLAGAIHYLFNYNAPLFNRYLRLVRRVLPNIESVAAPPISENTVQIRVWHTGYADGRADLAIPLDDCGTGIGQVLAILFIVVTSRIDQTIIIDEPNSFLHPSASRALIQVLQEEGRHQFVISTHSTDLIAATRPEKLLVIRWDEAQSKIDSFDGQDVEGLRASLAELGVRLSDVLGYDAVIWVEGQTEARCFPMLRAAADAAVSEGVGFVALANTGDLEGPHARIVLDIYRRVVRQGPFLKPPVAISLDAELRSEDEMNAIIKESGGVVRFLPRRSLENFLISAGGIAAVLSKLVDSPPSAQTVGDWIDLHHLDEKYYPRKPHVSEDWRQGINASEFIQDLISDLTHQRYDFRGNKATFSSSVVSWMIANERPAIQLLIDYVAKLAESSQSAQDRPA